MSLDFVFSLSTPRLDLRCPRVDDFPLLEEAVVESLPDLDRWFRFSSSRDKWDYPASGVSLAEIFYREEPYASPAKPFHLFTRGAAAAFIGACGLHSARRNRGQAELFSAELWFWVRSGQQSKGYATEAAAAVTAFALSEWGCAEAWIAHETANVASEGVCRRLGFTPVGSKCDYVRARGLLRGPFDCPLKVPLHVARRGQWALSSTLSVERVSLDRTEPPTPLWVTSRLG